jgi:hypothetical protein
MGSSFSNKHPKADEDEDEEDCDIPPETPSAPCKWLVGFCKGIPLAKVIGLLSQRDSMHRSIRVAKFPNRLRFRFKKDAGLGFLDSDIDRPEPRSVHPRKSCRFPSASITTTLTVIPISSASILPPEG